MKKSITILPDVRPDVNGPLFSQRSSPLVDLTFESAHKWPEQ